jgi:hypothetical protein
MWGNPYPHEAIMRIVLAILLLASPVWAGFEPSGPYTYYNPETGQTRVATGGPLRNYFDGSIWRKINPDFQAIGGQLVADSGYHKVITDPTENIIWLDWNGHTLGIKAGNLYAYRKSTDTRTPIATPDFTYRSYDANIITITGIYPNVDLEIENRTGHLRHRFIFHQAARDDFETWWQNNGQHDDIYVVNAFRLYVGQLNCDWRDQVGDFDLSVDRDITGLVELRYGDAAEFFLGDERVKLSTGPVDHTPLYKRVMLIGGNPYLAEGFKWTTVRVWNDGDIIHNATFGNQSETETASHSMADDETVAARFQGPNFSGTLDSVYAFVHDNWSVNDTAKFFIYSDSTVAGQTYPGHILASASGRVAIFSAAATYGWKGDAVSVALTSGEYYWMGLNLAEITTGGGTASINASAATGGDFNNIADPLPLIDPWDGGTVQVKVLSIYGVYTLDTGDGVEMDEYIDPDADTAPDDWTNTGGANKLASITDNVTANYISETTDEQAEEFGMANPTSIAGDDTIDSVKFIWRGKDGGSGNNRAMPRIIVGADTSDGTSVALLTTWAYYEDNFTTAPDAGAWTLTDLNSLEIWMQCKAISNTVFAERAFIRIYYTTAAGVGGDYPMRRRHMIEKLSGGL